jgi:protocatechuate 3,4-dioxygenase beta subunit
MAICYFSTHSMNRSDSPKPARALKVRPLAFALCLSGLVAQLPVRGAYVTGLVVDDQSGRPLDKVRVVVWDKLKSRALSEGDTDSSGRFQVDQLPPAPSYVVGLARQNYLETAALVAPAGRDSGSTLVLRLIRHGVIAGRVLDGNDRPVRGARVYLFLPESSPSYGQPLRFAQTDNDGRYRLFGLPPGEYVIGAQGIADRGKPVRGILSTGDTVAVFGDEHEQDLRMPQSPLLEIGGVVRRNDLRNSVLSVGLLDTRHPALSVAVQQAAPSGEFRFENVLPGTYDLMAHTFGREAPESEFGRVHVKALSVGIQGIEIRLRTGANASFTIRPGTAGTPAEDCRAPATIKLSPSEAFLGARALTASAATGTVTFGPLAPSVYWIEANSDECQSAASQIDLRAGNDLPTLPIAIAKRASIQGRIEVKGEPRHRVVVLIPYGPVIDGGTVLVQDLGTQERTFFIDHLSAGRYYVVTRTLDGSDQPWKPRAHESRIGLTPGARLEVQISDP